MAQSIEQLKQQLLEASKGVQESIEDSRNDQSHNYWRGKFDAYGECINALNEILKETDGPMARFEKAEGDFHQLAVAGGVNDVPNYDGYNPELDQADGFRA